MRCEKDKKGKGREKQTQVQRSEEKRQKVRESNARERRGWTETKESTKRAAELNYLCGSLHFVFFIKNY